jgi:putative ABC transport system permease protein
VLLIGVGNLTSLQLARNGARAREVTVRLALGASRWQVVRALVVESIVLSGAGGALGLAAAYPAVRLIASMLPPRFPRADQIGVDLGVALFACAVSLVVGVVVGGLPAWHTSRDDLTKRLTDGGRSSTLGVERSRTQRALIAFQVAVALVLLVGAGLLGNSFYRLISRDAGMQEDRLWLLVARLPARYRDVAVQTAFWTRALEQVRAVPGISFAAVSVNSTGPSSGGDISTTTAVEGVPLSPRDGLRISYRRVSDEYFRTIGTPLVKGRPINASDHQGAERVVVINELAASALWPGQDPIGKRLQAQGGLATVVGVIPTFRHTRLDSDFSAQMFTPYLQGASIAQTSAVLLRAAPRHTVAVTAAKTALTNLESDLDVSVSTMSEVRWKLLATERFRVGVIISFAGSAVFLAIIGIVGLVSYTVSQRQREIAVRVALGAKRRDVLQLASRHAFLPALVGLAFGVCGAAVVTRLLTTYLVDIQPLDLPTFATAIGTLAMTTFGASVIPARRALEIEPSEALRAE